MTVLARRMSKYSTQRRGGAEESELMYTSVSGIFLCVFAPLR